jgi:hypothetical protein
MGMSYRIVFVLATGLLFASALWSDNDTLSDSVPVVFNPQPASLISPPDSPLNDDCSRAIPLEDGIKVWGTNGGYGVYSWYSFTPDLDGTLKVTMESADPNCFMALRMTDSCTYPDLNVYDSGEYGKPLIFFQEVKHGQPYFISATCPYSYEGDISIQVDLIPPAIPGDVCLNAIEIALDTSIEASTVGSVVLTSPGSSNQYRDVWFKLAPSFEGCVRFSVSGEDGMGLGLNLFESCGGPDLGSASTDTELGRAHCYLDVQPGSEYLIQIGQDADSTAPFVFEARIVPTIPVFGRIGRQNIGGGSEFGLP